MDIKIIKDVCIFDKNRLGYLHFLILDKDFGFGYNKISLCGEIILFSNAIYGTITYTPKNI